jgi:hypothetical protein
MIQINYRLYMSSYKDTFEFRVMTVFIHTKYAQGSKNMLYTKYVCWGSKEVCNLI